MTYTFVPLSLITIVLLFGTYARVTEHSFVVNRFIGIGEKEYAFDEISSITLTKSFKAPNGNIIRKPAFSIGFKDGSNYDFHKAIHDLSWDEERRIAEFVSKSSNMGIIVNDLY
jgi:hypothetical protein